MRPAALLAAVLLLAGCASSDITSTPASTSATILRGIAVPPPDQLVFQVETVGGFVPAAAYATGRPWLSVYGDGRAFVLADRGNTTSDTPIRFEQASMPRKAVFDLITRAAATGLFTGKEHDFGDPGITDSPTTKVKFRPDAAPAHEASAYALYYAEDGDLTDRQTADRNALRNLISDVDDAVVPDPTSSTWTPERIDVTELDLRTPPYDPQQWPGPRLSTLLQSTDRGRCGVVSGATARTIYDIAVEQGNQFWREGSVTKPLAIRALLPGEKGC